MFVSLLPSFEYDQSAYRYFSAKLVHEGLNNFFSSGGFTLNSVGYFYPLWIIGLIKEYFFSGIDFFSRNYDFLLKIPATLTDILSGIFIYSLIKKRGGKKLAIIGFLMYVFNPAIFFNSSIWGQYDSISTFFLLLSAWSVINKKPLLMASCFAIALSFKPQALFFTPVAAILTFKNTKPVKWFLSFCVFLLTTLVIYLPFFPKNPFYGIYFVNFNLAKTYNCTTCFALNFWGIFGNWQNDSNSFISIPFMSWGGILLSITLLVLLLSKPFTLKYKPPYFYFTSAISMMAFFMLLTRMHERYLFPLLPFLLLTAIMLKSRLLIGFYAFMSTLHLLNLYIPYAYYNNLAKVTNLPVNQLTENFQVFSIISFLSFLFLFIYFLYYVKHKIS